MKKWLAIIVAVMMAMTAFAAFAEEEAEAATPTIPKTIEEYGDLATVSVDDFAKMTTKTKDGETTVTLSQAVDSLQANWMGEGEEPENLTVGEDLTATVTVSGHKQQLGSSKSGGMQPGNYWDSVYEYEYSYTAEDDPAAVEAGIQAAYDYMNSEEFEKKVSTLQKQYPDAVSWSYDQEPRAYVVADRYDEELEGWIQVESIDMDPSATYEELEAERDKLAEKYADDPEVDVWYSKYDGNVGFIMYAPMTKGLLGAPNHAFVTKQAGFNVIYGRNGKVMQISKDIENADYFGVGTGTAHLVYQMTNVGWRLATVTMEYPEGSKVSAIQAKYNGNGDLYGSAIK